MKIKLNKKAKIITVIVAFAAIVGVGVVLDKVQEDRFIIETYPTGASMEGDVKELAENGAMVSQTEIPTEQASDSEIINGKININEASQEVLCKLNGIGESMAKRIIDYRTEHGKFESIEELVLVNGIGEKKLNAIKDSICVD